MKYCYNKQMKVEKIWTISISLFIIQLNVNVPMMYTKW